MYVEVYQCLNENVGTIICFEIILSRLNLDNQCRWTSKIYSAINLTRKYRFKTFEQAQDYLCWIPSVVGGGAQKLCVEKYGVLVNKWILCLI